MDLINITLNFGTLGSPTLQLKPSTSLSFLLICVKEEATKLSVVLQAVRYKGKDLLVEQDATVTLAELGMSGDVKLTCFSSRAEVDESADDAGVEVDESADESDDSGVSIEFKKEDLVKSKERKKKKGKTTKFKMSEVPKPGDDRISVTYDEEEELMSPSPQGALFGGMAGAQDQKDLDLELEEGFWDDGIVEMNEKSKAQESDIEVAVSLPEPSARSKPSAPKNRSKVAVPKSRGASAATAKPSTSTNVITDTIPQSSSLAYFSGFAPPIIASGSVFIFNVWAYCKMQRAEVMAIEKAQGNSEAGMKGPLRIKIGSVIVVTLDLPKEAFEVDDPKSTMEWEGEASNCSFAITCKKNAKPGTYICKATISVAGTSRGALMCQFQVAKDPKSAQSQGFFAKLLRSCAPFMSNNGSGPGSELKPSTEPYFSAIELQKQHLMGVASSERKSIRAVSPAVDLNGAFTIFPSGDTPHVFLSYRRLHIDLADRIRMVLKSYGYDCFLDISNNGLEAGSFTEQLRNKLSKAAVVIPILTPAPAGKGGLREELSSLGWVKEAHKQGITDWCHEELRMALDDDKKIIVPVFRGVDLSEEFKDLPEDISKLPDLNCRQLHDDLFEESVRVIHKFIQSQLVNRELQNS